MVCFRYLVALLTLFCFAVQAVRADSITTPYTFSAGQVIQSAQMNSNFTAVNTAVNGKLDTNNLKAAAGVLPTQMDLTKEYPILRTTLFRCFSAGNTGDTSYRWTVDADGKVHFGAGGASATDMLLKRVSSTSLAIRDDADANDRDLTLRALTASGTITAAGITGTAEWTVLRSAANRCISAGTTGDTVPRITMTSDGTLDFGPGSASAVDTRLKRESAGVLAVRNGTTDNAYNDLKFQNGTVGGTLGVTGVITAAAANAINFANTGLTLNGTGGSFTTTLKQNSNEAANRTLNIPALGGNDTLACIGQAQTFTAVNTMNGANIITHANTGCILNDTGSHTTTIKQNSSEASNRTVNIPALGGNDTFAMLGQGNAFTGSNTFSTPIPIASGGTGAATAAGYSIFGNNTSGSAAPAFQTQVREQLPATAVIFGGVGGNTSARALPTSGTLTGEYWNYGNWSSAGTLTFNRVRIHNIGTMDFNHAVTVNTELSGGAQGAVTGGSYSGPEGAPGQGLGAGRPGFGLSAGVSSGGGGGGANGGNGGAGGAYSVFVIPAQGGASYQYEHLLPGSGGGAGSAYTNVNGGSGGAGGGALYIESTGNVTVNANITATGAAGTAGNGASDGGGGGGAGGTVAIISLGNVTINAAKTVSVAGGNGGAGGANNSGGGGGGGGGRFFVRCAGTYTNSGTVTTTAGSAGASTAPTTAASAGAAGVTDTAGGTTYSLRTAP